MTNTPNNPIELQNRASDKVNGELISFIRYLSLLFAAEITLVLVYYLFRLDFDNWLSHPSFLISVVIVGLAILSIFSWFVALNYRKIEAWIESLCTNPKKQRRSRNVLVVVFSFSLILTLVILFGRVGFLQSAKNLRLTWNNAILALLIIFLINSVALLWKGSKNIINLTRPFSRHKAEMWSVALLQLLLIFVFFSPILEQNKIPVNSDYILKFYPWRSVQSSEGSIINPVLSDSIDGDMPLREFFKDSLAEGEFPLWNPYVSGGTPFGLLLFSGTFNLKNLGVSLAGPAWGAVLYFFIKLFIAGYFFYLFLRGLGISVPASLLGMITYTFSSYIIVNLATDVADSLVFAPVILFEGERWLAEKKYKHLVWLSVVITFTILSGFPAITLFVLLFTVEYFVFRVLFTGPKAETWKDKFSKLAALAGGYLAGIGLAGISLLPTMEFFKEINLSYRVGRGNTVLAPEFIMRLFTNNICGSPVERGFYCGSNYNETALYTSLIAILLIPVAFRKNNNRSFAILLLLNTLFVLATVFGFMKVNLLVAKIPLLNISANTRMIAMLPLLLCPLGAIGFDGLLEKNNGRLIFLFEAIFVLLLTYVIWRMPSQYPLFSKGGAIPTQQTLYSGVICLTFLGLFAIIQVLKSQETRLLLGIIIIVFSFFDIGQLLLRYNGASDPKNVELVPPGITYLMNNQQSYERMVPLTNNTLVPSLGMSYRLNALLGHWFTSPEYRAVISLIDPKIYSNAVVTQPIFTNTIDAQSPLINLLRVKHFVASPSVPATFDLQVAALQYEYNNNFEINQYDKFSQSMISIRDQTIGAILLRVNLNQSLKSIPVNIKVYIDDVLRSQTSTDFTQSLYKGWYIALFPPIEVREGQTVNVEIDPTDPESIGKVYLVNFNIYRQGKFQADGEPVDKDIAFILASKSENIKDLPVQVYGNDIMIYENKDLPKNLPIIRQVIKITDSTQCISALSDIDPYKTAIVDYNGNLPVLSAGPNSQTETAQITGYTTNTVEIQAKLISPALIVLSDSYFPGWEVAIDGKPSQIIRTNCAMRGVFVETGAHIIEMEYRPTSGLVGGIISGMSCLILLVTGILRKHKSDLRATISSM